MKKYIYSLLTLSIMAAIIAAALMFQHHYPETSLGILSCESGLENPCITLSASTMGSICGLPVSLFGLLLGLFMTFTLLIADYAGGWYIRAAALVILPLSALALLADIILGAFMMLETGVTCRLCLMSYAVHAAIFAISIPYYRSVRVDSGGFTGLIRSMLADNSGGADRRAAMATFTIFLFLLAFSLFSVNQVMRGATAKQPMPAKEIRSDLDKFYATAAEKAELPESSIVLGNREAKLSIHVYTDFLCSACYSLYRTEKYLLPRFRGKINFVYHHYPLDSKCNSDVPSTVYENSCVASRAMEAASSMNILEKYIVAHFRHYRELNHSYTREWAMKIFAEATGGSGDAAAFEKAMDSRSAGDAIESQIKSAIRVTVDATPTIFVNGRRMVGVPPREVFEGIIRKELEKK
jgi:protein-disulfide isomerase